MASLGPVLWGVCCQCEQPWTVCQGPGQLTSLCLSMGTKQAVRPSEQGQKWALGSSIFVLAP